MNLRVFRGSCLSKLKDDPRITRNEMKECAGETPAVPVNAMLVTVRKVALNTDG